MNETVGAALGRARAALAAAGVESPGLEARLLLAAALDTTPEALLRDPAAAAGGGLDPLLARRVAHEPLALILGWREFWSLRFAVSPATLIPRPDSETLIEAALAARPVRAAVRRVLDLGTGTGCLLLAALSEFAGAFGVGVDLSPEAAALAAANAAAFGFSGRAAFLAGNWDAAIDARFDLVLCNPPYIESAAIAKLMPEVAAHEPRRALDGGADGLAAYRMLLPRLPFLLGSGGIAVLELGAGQFAAVEGLAQAAGFTHVASRADLAGLPRALILGRT